MRFIPLKSVAYGNILQATRNVMEKKYRNFPDNGCQFVSRLLSDIMINDYFGEVGGTFQHESVKRTRNHVWLYDRSLELYIDLTLDQFLKNAPKVSILPSNTKILTRRDFQTLGASSVPSEKYYNDQEFADLVNLIADEKDILDKS